MLLRVAGIYHNDIANGPNLRTVLYVQGCPHHCKGCHNQHTWKFNSKDAVNMTKEQVIDELTCNPMDRGITISGGEPICQWRTLLPIVRELYLRKYDLMLYTGYTQDELNKYIKSKQPEFLEFLTYFSIIVTEPFILEKRITDRSYFRGSSNQKFCKIHKGTLVEIPDTAVPDTIPIHIVVSASNTSDGYSDLSVQYNQVNNPYFHEYTSEETRQEEDTTGYPCYG